MRLTCPNCGAQYEVPDEVIPADGRDVQCSNCGDTWFQAHSDTQDAAPDPETAPQIPEAAEEDFSEPDADDMPDDPETTFAEPESVPESVQEPAPEQSSGIDSEISDILREEAQREAQLRATETSEPLESQPNLGLDDLQSDEPSKRAREARDRMARMRGERSDDPNPKTAAESRREMLPDIEEINSSLRTSDQGASPNTAVGPVRADQSNNKRGGFTRGFALIIVIGVVLALIYVKAPGISKAVPQVDPALNSYVEMVDKARIWLDSQLGGMVPKPEE